MTALAWFLVGVIAGIFIWAAVIIWIWCYLEWEIQRSDWESE